MDLRPRLHLSIIERTNCLWYRLHTMTCRAVKSCVVIALCFAVLYAGVAWAMERCLRHESDPEQFAMGDRHDSNSASEFNHSQDPSGPIIHCALVSEQVGPAARGASAEVSRSDRGVGLRGVSIPLALFTVPRNDLWLEALFKRIVTFSRPADLARHLILSVLRI